MPRLSLVVALSLMLSTTSGCATIMAGGPSKIEVTIAEPPKHVTTQVRGVLSDDAFTTENTQFTVDADRSSPYVFAVSSDGYEPQLVVVKSEINPYYWGNLLLSTVAFVALLGSTSSRSNQATLVAVAALAQLVTVGGPLVDIVTKNAYRHSTQAVNVRLEKREPAQKE